MFSVPGCLLGLCSRVAGGGCWGSQRRVLPAEVYRACSCTEGGGVGCGLRQAELPEKPYNRSQGSLGQQAGSTATVPLEGAAACGASSSLCLPPKGCGGERGCSKGSSSQRGPKHLSSLHRGEGQPTLSKTQAAAGWSVTNSCRVTWLLGKEVLNFSHCPLGRLLYRLHGAGKVFCFVLFFPKNQI